MKVNFGVVLMLSGRERERKKKKGHSKVTLKGYQSTLFRQTVQ